jgi:hypothetical protein
MSETTDAVTQAKPEPKSFVRHAIELNPFQVPSFVTMAMPPREPGAPVAAGDPPVFHLRELPPEILESLCGRFRAGVFEKAGKRPPRRRSASKSAGKIDERSA